MVLQKKILILLAVCLLLVSVIIDGCATTQKSTSATSKFTAKPITMIIPFSAGGGTDLMARAMGKVSTKYLGQSLVIVNKPGGTGTIGWNELASSTPDGYTIGMTVTDLLLQPLYGATRYHYLTALEPLAQISSSPSVMIVQANEPWQNVNELIEYAKQHPGQLKFGHAGIGSLPHIIGETFGKVANIDIEQVPFSGSSEATAALLGKHIQIAFMNPMSVKEQIKSGSVRVLAVSSEKRLSDPALAQIPTFKEQGLDVAFSYWYGVAAPKELSLEDKAELAQGLKRMICDPDFKSSMDALGMEVEYLGPEETKTRWLDDNVKLTAIIKETGILDRIKEQRK